MNVHLQGRNFVAMKDFTPVELQAVLDLARQLKQEQKSGRATPLLANKTLAMIFQKPSLRTRVSFETGMTQLGGHAIYLAPSDIKLGERETTEDIAMVLGRYADVIMARVFGHHIVEELARHAGVPVINGLSDHEHPCQIVADLQTIIERRGQLKGLHLVFVGDGNNVAHSLMYGGALTGMHVTVACPPGYEPQASVLEECQMMARTTGAKIQVRHEVMEAVRGADVVYTDVWASMGQEAEAEKRRRAFVGYQINVPVVQAMNTQAVVLHCLPAHYGEEIDYPASRLPNSAIFDQAENRLHAQKAIMVALVTGKV
ncbi:MAG: Ornithine carbamoyltransferase [Phycisphaerae bacterium]|nr:Ornithine carbamoyltransferase [Phycisphaerae bacterium]